MLMGELSNRSGVPIAMITYYLREELLFPGVATAPACAHYGESHIRRLRLIQALLEIGDFPLPAIRRILAAVDDETVPSHQMLGTAALALGPSITGRPTNPTGSRRATRSPPCFSGKAGACWPTRRPGTC